MTQNIIQFLSKKINANHNLVEDFFVKKFKTTPPSFYNSVDLRHSGFKIAPIDTNCFPAGFNNLSPLSIGDSKQGAKKVVADFFIKNFPEIKKILIIPENHTRNIHYFENIFLLKKILEERMEVVIGTTIPDLDKELSINLSNSKSITLHPIKKGMQTISTINGFEPELILMNNDLTDGVPEILKDISIKIVPSPDFGWYKRTKSKHFNIYNRLAKEFALLLDIDPWLISSMHLFRSNLDFKNRNPNEGRIDLLAQDVDSLIKDLRQKYSQYDINEEPYCYIKADSGTYGMAVLPVFSGDDVLSMSKKERNKMNMLKGSVQNTKVIIQEGIKTIDKINQKASEPMIYLINGTVVGNLFRINETKGEKLNLNSKGATFVDLNDLEQSKIDIGDNKNSATKVYSVLSRLACLAAANENIPKPLQT